MTAVPMLIIANAYRRLNLWNANCGASFEWVGRAINPYLGFLTGWLMIAGYIIGAVSGVEVLGPSVLAVFGANATQHRGQHHHRDRRRAGHAGDRSRRDPAHRADPGRHGHGRVRDPRRLRHRRAWCWSWATIPAPSRSPAGWFSLPGSAARAASPAGCCCRGLHLHRLGRHPVRQRGSQAPAGQPRPGRRSSPSAAHRHLHPVAGRPARRGVPGRLQAHAADALVYVAPRLGGGGWAKVMALALALSVIAATGTGIVLTARIIYGMASCQVLPAFLAQRLRAGSPPRSPPASWSAWSSSR